MSYGNTLLYYTENTTEQKKRELPPPFYQSHVIELATDVQILTQAFFISRLLAYLHPQSSTIRSYHRLGGPDVRRVRFSPVAVEF
jgi:hypothetical protein